MVLVMQLPSLDYQKTGRTHIDTHTTYTNKHKHINTKLVSLTYTHTGESNKNIASEARGARGSVSVY